MDQIVVKNTFFATRIIKVEAKYMCAMPSFLLDDNRRKEENLVICCAVDGYFTVTFHGSWNAQNLAHPSC